ncbi:MAG: hypothetical protein ACREYF_21165 [Gammaproteobacteria bacterium]
MLSQFDLFADALTQRSEHETGVWLSGLDVVAADALSLPDYYPSPPVVCYLDHGRSPLSPPTVGQAWPVVGVVLSHGRAAMANTEKPKGPEELAKATLAASQPTLDPFPDTIAEGGIVVLRASPETGQISYQFSVDAGVVTVPNTARPFEAH